MSSTANRGFNRLYRNADDARWLGVCAGVADWLDIPITLVRVIFVICVLAWPTLAIGYFILYFCLSDEDQAERTESFSKIDETADHFRQLDYRKAITKNERNKRIAGVCSGIADYLEVSPFVVRAATIGSMFVFGPFTIWAYIICVFVFDPDPNTSNSERYERKMAARQKRHERREQRYQRKAAKRAAKRGFSNSYVNEDVAAPNHTPRPATKTRSAEAKASFDEAVKTYQTLETKLRDIEAYMTSKKFRLHCEINRI